MLRWLLWLVVLFGGGQAFAIETFFAPAVPIGSIEVRLHPTETVATGSPVLVTFGMPFPRGSITVAGLSTLRVMRGNTELPIFVEALTPWRHRSNAAIDGASVRIARVQLQYTFSSGFPANEPITVSWGGPPRTLNLPNFSDPRSAWHQVTSGSFVAADNVFEPDVYAVLPASWLVRGAVSSVRSTAFDPGNTEARDNPATNDAVLHWPAFQEAERALKNNFYTMVLRDDPLVPLSAYPPYKSDREPWLYDRAATMYALYLRSGFFTALRQAVQNSQFYADRVNAQGFFTLAPGDSKYSYNENLAYTYWLTGDPVMAAKIDTVVLGHNSYVMAWTPTRGFWTERHAAFKLLALVIAYEVHGGTTRRDAVNTALTELRTHQDGAGGQIPANRIDGGLYHFGSQHDGDWAATSLGGSSWMSALLSDAVVRAYATGEDAPTAIFMRRLGQFLRATLVLTTAHSYDTSDALWLPRYAMLIDGSDGQFNDSDGEHALDVAGQLAWASWFAAQQGADPAQLRQATLDTYLTYDESVNFWIRPSGPAAGLPAFRVAPPRKWGWEHRTSTGLAFALSEGSAPPDVVFASGFE